MGYCSNSPKLLQWKQPGLECMELSDLHAISRGTMAVGLWRMWSLRLRLKDLGVVYMCMLTPCPTF